MKRTAIALAIVFGSSTAAFAVDPTADVSTKAGTSIDTTATVPATPAVPAVPAEPMKPAASASGEVKTKPYGKSDTMDKSLPGHTDNGERNRGAASENNTAPGGYGERSGGEPAANNVKPAR